MFPRRRRLRGNAARAAGALMSVYTVSAEGLAAAVRLFAGENITWESFRRRFPIKRGARLPVQ